MTESDINIHADIYSLVFHVEHILKSESAKEACKWDYTLTCRLWLIRQLPYNNNNIDFYIEHTREIHINVMYNKNMHNK